MDPRISFSNDFADPQHQQGQGSCFYREAPVSSDFEFRVSNNGMIQADEIFSKGMLLPLSENGGKKMVTLREELLQDDDDDEEKEELSFSSSRFSSKTSSSAWWKHPLGLKRSHVAIPTNTTTLPVLDKSAPTKAY